MATSWTRRLVQRPKSPTISISSTTKHENGNSDHPARIDPWHKVFLLTLDGGGIRGLSTLLILQELMEVIGRVERKLDSKAIHSYFPDEYIHHEASKFPLPEIQSHGHHYLPCHYFDRIDGVSTGGLIAIMLGRLRMPVDDCIAEYERFGGEVFGQPRRAHIRGKKRRLAFNPFKDKFSTKPLRMAVKRVVQERDPFPHISERGERIQEASLECPDDLCQTGVWAVEGSSNGEGWLLRSHAWRLDQTLRGRNQHTERFTIHDAACAATAAPTFFKPANINGFVFYDAGILFNNPCQSAVDDVLDYLKIKLQTDHPPEDHGYLGAVVSIGTGKVLSEKLKPPKSWLGRFGEAVSWERRRADNSSEIHRLMKEFSRNTRERQKTRKIPSQSQFHYSRFTVGAKPECSGDADVILSPDAQTAVAKMAHMKMDEWNTKPGTEPTISRIREATRAYLAASTVQEELQRTAEVLVANRRERSLGSHIDPKQPNPILENQCRWYRYASAKAWECRRGCGHPMYDSVQTMKAHLRDKHQEDELKPSINANRKPCIFRPHYH